MCRCQFPDGAKISIGDVELDPCRYKVKEIHKNVTIEVLECGVCGHISIGWRRQENTVDIVVEEESHE